jgi:hypothetical protein
MERRSPSHWQARQAPQVYSLPRSVWKLGPDPPYRLLQTPVVELGLDDEGGNREEFVE